VGAILRVMAAPRTTHLASPARLMRDVLAERDPHLRQRELVRASLLARPDKPHRVRGARS
jgi:hypothetical protein